MAYFPLFINLEGRYVLVIGGGQIAERRVKALLEFDCRICMVTPELTADLEVLADEGKIIWHKERYHREMLQDRNLFEEAGTKSRQGRLLFVLAAAEESVNAEVAKDCRAVGIPVNNASRKEECDFYFPGLVKEEELVIGITSGGSDHKAVAALSKKIRELVRKTWQA